MAASLTGADKEKRVTDTDQLRKLEIELCHLRIVFVVLCVTVGAFFVIDCTFVSITTKYMRT